MATRRVRLHELPEDPRLRMSRLAAQSGLYGRLEFADHLVKVQAGPCSVKFSKPLVGNLPAGPDSRQLQSF